jgi:predicted nuclease of predicted toxin-antitoxin system
LTRERLKLRAFLDEGVPVEVSRIFEAHGHEVVPFAEALKPGSADVLVCAAAQANEAILVAFDRDMKKLAQRQGVSAKRFSKLHLLQFECQEPMAATRLEQAMSLVVHEWAIIDAKAARLHIVIGKQVLRSHR